MRKCAISSVPVIGDRMQSVVIVAVFCKNIVIVGKNNGCQSVSNFQFDPKGHSLRPLSPVHLSLTSLELRGIHGHGSEPIELNRFVALSIHVLKVVCVA